MELRGVLRGEVDPVVPEQLRARAHPGGQIRAQCGVIGGGAAGLGRANVDPGVSGISRPALTPCACSAAHSAGSQAMIASLLSWSATHAAAAVCARLAGAVAGCVTALAAEGVLAARARAAGAAVPAKTPLNARAATVMTAATATAATTCQRPARSTHSLIVVARTRVQDGSDIADLVGLGARFTVSPAGSTARSGAVRVPRFSSMPPGGARRLSSLTFATPSPSVSAASRATAEHTSLPISTENAYW